MRLDELIGFYNYAKDAVIRHGFASEIKWQKERDTSSFNESDFLQEFAWVCFCSGFRESVIRRLFDYLSLCFCDWESAEIICQKKRACYESAIAVLKNNGKIGAVIRAAEMIQEEGFELLKSKIVCNPFDELRRFPYIGDVTVFHLAKNLGFQVAKPDRHLVRLAETTGIGDVQVLCDGISKVVGDPINVVDLVLWRFAVLSVSARPTNGTYMVNKKLIHAIV